MLSVDSMPSLPTMNLVSYSHPPIHPSIHIFLFHHLLRLSTDDEGIHVEHQISSTFLDLESSDDDGERRVVRSEKDKRWDQLRATIRGLRNHIKINDWVAIGNDFDELLKICERAARKVGVPRFFIKQMLQLEELTHSTLKEKDKTRKMKKPNFRALNAMRQNIKKRFRIPFESQIEAYLKNPLLDEEEAEDEDEEEDEGGLRMGAVSVLDLVQDETDLKAAEDDDEEEEGAGAEDAEDEDFEGDEEEEEWSDDDWELDEDEDSDDDLELESHGHAIFTREFWVKKKVKDTEKGAETEKKSRAQRQLERAEAKAQSLKEARERAAAEEASGKKKKKKEAGEVTPELVIRKLKEVLDARGKRGTDRNRTIQELEDLVKRVEDNPKISAALSLKVKTTLAQTYFETALNAVSHMPVNLWRKCVPILQSILTELMVNPLVRLTEDEEIQSSLEESLQSAGDRISSDEVQRLMSEVTASQKLEREEAEDRRRQELERKEGGKTEYVQGNLFSFISHMATEYTKSLRGMDPLQTEYLERLKDESTLLILIAQSEQYYRKIDKRSFLVRITGLRLEFLYYVYHRDQDVLSYLPEDRAALLERDPLQVDLEATGKAAVSGGGGGGGSDEVSEEESKYATRASYTLIRSLATYLYRHGDPRAKLRALLCHVYYLALHNHYREAREYLLMGYIQDVIDKADILTRILYNRAVTQLGLAAFRRGELRQSLDALNELNQTNRAKELLAQGLSRQPAGQRDPTKEMEERRRQLPYHMHINLEVFEGATLISAMSVDVPNFARRGFRGARSAASRNFHRLLEKSKQAFHGPPESTRDYIVAAAQSMMEGDWQTCWRHIEKLRLWKIVPEAETVKSAVRRSLQLAALTTFLHKFAEHHTSLSLPRLEQNFQLPPEIVKRVLSRMIHEDELQGALDLETQSVILHKSLPNQLQRSALEFVDKVGHLVDANERIAEHNVGGRFHRRGGQGGFRGGRRGLQRRGGYRQGFGGGGGGDRRKAAPSTEASAAAAAGGARAQNTADGGSSGSGNPQGQQRWNK